MTTIKNLQEMPIGQGTGGYFLSIKTHKKMWQVGEIWWNQVICMDETGEIPVDVKIGTAYSPLRGRANRINVIVAKVQMAEYLGKDRKKLVVDQFTIPTETVDEYQSKQDEMDKEVKLIVESKVRCWLVSSSIQGKQLNKVEILDWQKFVLTGE